VGARVELRTHTEPERAVRTRRINTVPARGGRVTNLGPVSATLDERHPGGIISASMHPFRAAIEAEDFAAAVALLAEDVVFRSPIVFKPYRGREAVAPLLLAVSRVFEDFRYEREIGAPGAPDHALVFNARVGDRELEGCDFLHTDEHGLIDDFSVMVRPLSAALALAEAMRAQLEAAQRELGEQASL
jgi:hypothetical protein